MNGEYERGTIMLDSLEVLNKINNLYSGALNQIITYTIGLMAFVGILLPILISFVQNRQFRRDHDAITSMIAKEITNAQEKLEKQISDTIEDKFREFRLELLDQVQLKTRAVSGRVNHNQALSLYRDNQYIDAIYACTWAADDYLAAADEANLIRILNVMDPILNRLNKSDFEENTEIKVRLDRVIENIKEINSNGRYSNEITKLSKNISSALKREESK